MPLRNLLKKRDTTREDSPAASNDDTEGPFTFLRTTTSTQEVIYPPTFPGDKVSPAQKKAQALATAKLKEQEKEKKKLDATESLLSTSPKQSRPGLHFRSSSRSSVRSTASADSSTAISPQKNEKRLSHALEKLSIGRRSRASSASSAHVPEDLPEISGSSAAGKGEVEAEWERRAALLAMQNEKSRGGTPVPIQSPRGSMEAKEKGGGKDEHVNIQEAIRLHEAGDLEASTSIFGQLADPHGANDALAQILYGMALQHGWGIPPSPPLALHYHTLAASNSAALSSLSQSSNSPSSSSAKGELVLAIYELGNAFRHGWGCEKDAVAARKYYETAAELGDVDAMVEVAWCYETGFGGGKDKFKAATYLRTAEERGRTEVGNSWIYKDKYGGPKKSK